MLKMLCFGTNYQKSPCTGGSSFPAPINLQY